MHIHYTTIESREFTRTINVTPKRLNEINASLKMYAKDPDIVPTIGKEFLMDLFTYKDLSESDFRLQIHYQYETQTIWFTDYVRWIVEDLIIDDYDYDDEEWEEQDSFFDIDKY